MRLPDKTFIFLSIKEVCTVVAARQVSAMTLTTCIVRTQARHMPRSQGRCRTIDPVLEGLRTAFSMIMWIGPTSTE